MSPDDKFTIAEPDAVAYLYALITDVFLGAPRGEANLLGLGHGVEVREDRLHDRLLGAGFLDGHRGALIAQMAARGVWLKYRKLGELVQAEAKSRDGAK